MSIKKMTILALFTTLALIIFTVESAIPPLAPIPGIKLGLANIITLVTLCLYSPKDTFLVLFARILLSCFLVGQAMSLMYSLAGGIFCFLGMCLLHKLLGRRFLFFTSIAGAMCHNLGQVLVAFLITSVPGVWAYLPFLLLSGIVTGLFTGLCAQFSLKYLLPLTTQSRFFPKEDGDN